MKLCLPTLSATSEFRELFCRIFLPKLTPKNITVSDDTFINQARRGGRSGVRGCIRIDELSSLPSDFPFKIDPQKIERYPTTHLQISMEILTIFRT